MRVGSVINIVERHDIFSHSGPYSLSSFVYVIDIMILVFPLSLFSNNSSIFLYGMMCIEPDTFILRVVKTIDFYSMHILG